MIMIEPIAVGDAQLLSSNVSETDAALWDIATAYVVEDHVISTATHSLYVCETPNTGVDPDGDDGTNWTRLSATNKWKAFDSLLADQVSNANSITYTIQPVSDIAAIAFFGLDANSVTVDVTLGAQTLSFSRELVNVDDVEGWFSWLFSGVVREKEALFLDLPYFGVGTEYTITIIGDETAKVGQIILGKTTSVGTTQWGGEIGILDYSRKERDVYGNAIIVERRFSRLATFPIGIDAKRVRRIQRKMEDYRAKPAVWVGDDRSEYALIIYGFFKSYSHVLDQDDWSRAVITVESLV